MTHGTVRRADKLGSRSSGGYLNYIEPDRWLSEYLGHSNAERMLSLRRRYRL